MDIQIASNFERYLYYCVGGDSAKVREMMASLDASGEIAFADLEAANPGQVFVADHGSDDATTQTIRRVFAEHGYVLDPHTAVGVHVAEKLRRADVPCVCLSTAHPAKFQAAVAEATGRDDVGHHPDIDALADLPTRCETLPAEREAIRQYIVDKLG